SIFVNPTQFGVNEDLDTYPRDLAHDTKVAIDGGATVIFSPSISEMYPNGYNTYVNVEEITSILCGKSRPIHFRGVATVVTKLFNITSANRAYFGQKDAQQLAVIMRMVADLNINIEIIPCPIIRESDGLAMSSRNTYLSPNQRENALVLHKSLDLATTLYNSNERNIEILKNAIKKTIKSSPIAEIEYIEAVTFPELKPCNIINQKTLIALAVKFGETRLIDNLIIDPQA
ncbi:MAG: pantoate--beta-alanine ligase, partial [Oscillospiraceae bacterium]